MTMQDRQASDTAIFTIVLRAVHQILVPWRTPHRLWETDKVPGAFMCWGRVGAVPETTPRRR